MGREQQTTKKIVIKAQRKNNFGNKRTGRSGKTGKRAIIYKCIDGKEIELPRVSAPTFRELSRRLRESGLVPVNVILNHNGVTEF